MTYALVSDIQNEIKNIDFANPKSSVLTSSVEDFLDQADAKINMYLTQYVLPITGVESLLILKKIEIDLVAFRVTKIIDLTKSVPIPDSTIPQEITTGTCFRQAMNQLEMLKSNDLVLPDTDLVPESTGILSFHTEAGNNIQPVFHKEAQQW